LNRLLVRLDARTGTVQWATQALLTIESLALTGTALYGVGGTDDPMIQFTGEVLPVQKL